MYRSNAPVRFSPRGMGETPEAEFIKSPLVFTLLTVAGILSLFALTQKERA